MLLFELNSLSLSVLSLKAEYRRFVKGLKNAQKGTVVCAHTIPFEESIHACADWLAGSLLSIMPL